VHWKIVNSLELERLVFPSILSAFLAVPHSLALLIYLFVSFAFRFSSLLLMLLLSQYPPKYEYNYFVANRNTHAAQGHKEIRYGDNTAGNYFVHLPKGESKTMVNYVADEWGFFPITR
jgi:hypothetical protein